MMGAGKTTIGRALARSRGWEFIDSDAQVEGRAGRTVAEIWAAEGEQGFRALESTALLEAMATERPSVIAAAGGTVLDPRNWDALRSHHPVVWLRADPSTLAQRLGDGSGRPLLGAEPAAALKALAVQRQPLYAEVADVTIDVDYLKPQEILELIEVALRDDGADNA